MENKKAITEKVEVRDYEVIDVFRGSSDAKGYELRVDATHPGYRSGEEFSFVLRSYSNDLEFAASFEDDPGGHVWAKTNLCAATALEISGAEDNLDVKPVDKCDEQEKKILALALHLGESAEDVANHDFTISEHTGLNFYSNCRAFLVCDEDERAEAYAERLRESLWFLSSWLLAKHSPDGVNEEIIDLIKKAKECEGSNEPLFNLIEKNWGDLMEEADSYYPHGEALSSYDGVEHEVRVGGDFYYVYRG